MLIVDANILVSAVMGRSRFLIEETAARGVDLQVTEPQFDEAHRVLIEKLGREPDSTRRILASFAELILPLASPVYESLEPAARARLHPRAQPDWPTLAAALALGAAIWSNDRDFFGTGVAVWTTRNVVYAEPVQ